MNKYRKALIFVVFVSFFLLWLNYNRLIANEVFSPHHLHTKYIQYECLQSDLCGGWADRLKGILSSYAFALITDRSLTIKLTKGCNLREILDPNEVDWNYEKTENKNLSETSINMGYNFGYSEKFKTDISMFTNLKNIDLIRVRGPMMFANGLKDNQNLTEKIKSLGYEPSKFHTAFQIHKWYSKLFKMNKKMKEKYDFYLKKMKPSSDTKLICIQIRKSDPGDKETDVFPESRFFDFVNSTFLNTSDTHKYTIFVASSKDYVKIDAQRYFKDNRVVYVDNSSFHIDVNANECDQIENVLLEFNLMQNCDIGVVSHSGFGMLALLNRPDPFKDFYVFTKPYNDSMKMSNEEFISNWLNIATFVKFDKLGSVYFAP